MCFQLAFYCCCNLTFMQVPGNSDNECLWWSVKRRKIVVLLCHFACSKCIIYQSAKLLLLVKRLSKVGLITCAGLAVIVAKHSHRKGDQFVWKTMIFASWWHVSGTFCPCTCLCVDKIIDFYRPAHHVTNADLSIAAHSVDGRGDVEDPFVFLILPRGWNSVSNRAAPPSLWVLTSTLRSFTCIIHIMFNKNKHSTWHPKLFRGILPLEKCSKASGALWIHPHAKRVKTHVINLISFFTHVPLSKGKCPVLEEAFTWKKDAPQTEYVDGWREATRRQIWHDRQGCKGADRNRNLGFILTWYGAFISAQ